MYSLTHQFTIYDVQGLADDVQLTPNVCMLVALTATNVSCVDISVSCEVIVAVTRCNVVTCDVAVPRGFGIVLLCDEM